MNMNNLRLSLVYLFGVLALAAAQEDEPSHRLLRGILPLPRHAEAPMQPTIELNAWLKTKREEYAIANLVENDSTTDKSDDGIALQLKQSYQYPAKVLLKEDEPAAEYEVLSIESVENEYVSQSVQGDEAGQEESPTSGPTSSPTSGPTSGPVNDAPCPSGGGYKYLGDSKEQCSLIKFFCEKDFEYFAAGDCGCGCKPVA
jgi:hypothetical protein